MNPENTKIEAGARVIVIDEESEHFGREGQFLSKAPDDWIAVALEGTEGHKADEALLRLTQIERVASKPAVVDGEQLLRGERVAFAVGEGEGRQSYVGTVESKNTANGRVIVRDEEESRRFVLDVKNVVRVEASAHEHAPSIYNVTNTYAPHQPSQGDSPILAHFGYQHQGHEKLRLVAECFHNWAWVLEKTLPAGPEKSTALRKLIESKDAAVRAAVEGLGDES